MVENEAIEDQKLQSSIASLLLSADDELAIAKVKNIISITLLEADLVCTNYKFLVTDITSLETRRTLSTEAIETEKNIKNKSSTCSKSTAIYKKFNQVVEKNLDTVQNFKNYVERKNFIGQSLSEDFSRDDLIYFKYTKSSFNNQRPC